MTPPSPAGPRAASPFRVGLYLALQMLAWPCTLGCEQPVTQGLHFFGSERLDIRGWLTSPVVLADRATTAIWSQGMSGCKNKAG